MEGVFDFTDVGLPAEKFMTRPGTIDAFEIKKTEFSASKEKQTAYVKVYFENETTNFNHSFFLTKGAMPRLQHLLAAIHGEGGVLTGQVTTQQIKAKLDGKKVGLKVTGQVGSNGKGYPNLPYSGFAKPANEVSFLKFTAEEQKDIDKALEAIEASRSNNADNDSGGGAASGDASATSENF